MPIETHEDAAKFFPLTRKMLQKQRLSYQSKSEEHQKHQTSFKISV